jgi:hypothetical protein
MKKILYLISAILVLGCKPEDNMNPKPITSLDNLTINIAKTFVPVDLLKNSSRAVFVNEIGSERELSIEYLEFVRDQQFGGISYQAPYIQIRYLEDNGAIFLPQIRIQSEYQDYTNVNETVNVNLVTHVNQGFIANIVITANGQPIIGEIEPTMAIVNKQFTNVYSNFSPPAHLNSYAHIHYTTSQGIIAFQGEDNEMWVLDRLE